MTPAIPHITVCVCTRKRQVFLKRLLDALGALETEGILIYSIVVVDNDAEQSARLVVKEFSETSSVSIKYSVVPQQNIALARNQALQDATGDFIAFIDDDEFPVTNWLLALVSACNTFQADGVLGPVVPHFEQAPPEWILRGKFCDRPTHKTGFVIDCKEGRTGNVLFRRKILEGVPEPFRREFGSGGEDRDFFFRMIELGRVFVWCNEAVVYESVPPARWTRSFMLRRALLRGQVAAVNPAFSLRDLAKSIVAIPAYVVLLPFMTLLGHHMLMKYLVKTCDHLGRVLSLIGIKVIREKYVME
jgi:succinoglycan biosynthesis protein ExoM